MAHKPLPAPVARAMAELGDDLATWRRLRNLTIVEVAERADVSRGVVIKLEAGGGSTTESLLRVTRALGIMDTLVSAVDPYNSDVGRLRAEETLPKRIRHPAPRSKDRP